MPQPVTRTQSDEGTSMTNEMGTSDGSTPAERIERIRAELTRVTGLAAEHVLADTETIGAAEIAERAKAEISRITGLAADHVSAVRNEADGWRVTVDLIELKRIPTSSDVLAAYDATYTLTGSLLNYHRTRRYSRDQMMSGE